MMRRDSVDQPAMLSHRKTKRAAKELHLQAEGEKHQAVKIWV
jgi:hypothetical protein